MTDLRIRADRWNQLDDLAAATHRRLCYSWAAPTPSQEKERIQ